MKIEVKLPQCNSLVLFSDPPAYGYNAAVQIKDQDELL
jgi:hypothetical protein